MKHPKSAAWDDKAPSSERRRRESPLEAIVDLAAFASRSIPLEWILEGMPLRIARILGVPVVSIYLVDHDRESLILRGNTGLAPLAVGRVGLRVGEGLTGLAAQERKLIAIDRAPEHGSWAVIPEFDDAQYPVFVAAPLLDEGEPAGVLVAQREREPFTEQEQALFASLCGLLSVALRNADTDEARRVSGGQRRRAGGGTRRVVLPGSPAFDGRALGPLAAVRRPPRRAVVLEGDGTQLLNDAFATAERVLRDLGTRAAQAGLANEARFLEIYKEILDDSRFRGRSLELVASGAPGAEALSQVAREAVRTATRWTRSSFLEERARDLEDLCDALIMLTANDPRASMPSRTILMSDALSVYDLLVTARSRPVGIALTERAGGPRTRVLIELLALPAMLDVGGLFRWASDGDIAMLDAGRGLLLINPSRAEISELRASFDRDSEVRRNAASSA